MDLLYQYILYFAIYSVTGWAVETAFCTIRSRKFQNRGFLIGPLCPIYAAGALLIVIVMSLLPKEPLFLSVVAVFFLGLILTSIVEYVTGWLLEVLFKSRWWDYSDSRFNIKGRVCLENSLCFGALCVLLIHVIHPFVTDAVGTLQAFWRGTLAILFVVYLLSDFTVTIFTVLGLNKRLQNIHAGVTAIKEELDSFEWYNTFGIKERIARLYENMDLENPIFKAVIPLHEEIRHILHDNKSLQVRILQAFPNLKSVKYPEYLNAIKEQLALFRKKKNGQSQHLNENGTEHKNTIEAKIKETGT